MRSRLVMTLAAVDIALAGVLAWMLLDEQHRGPSEPAAVKPTLDEAGIAFAAPQADASAYGETLQRPLFVASRRPRAPKPAPESDAGVAADPVQQMRLLGLYGSGRDGGAIILHENAPHRVRFGERIGGWTVVGADGRSATLARDGSDRRKLVMTLQNETPADAARTGAPSKPQPTSTPVPTDDQVEDR